MLKKKLQVGTFAYLKNFRKGFLHQMARCRSQLAAATARGDLAAVQEAQHRLDWIFEKQRRLDVQHEMVTDKPSWQNGRMLPYGSLEYSARRVLTAAEIEWNEELIGALISGLDEERAATAAATASTLGAAAATASTLGAAGTETPATQLP